MDPLKCFYSSHVGYKCKRERRVKILLKILCHLVRKEADSVPFIRFPPLPLYQKSLDDWLMTPQRPASKLPSYVNVLHITVYKKM